MVSCFYVICMNNKVDVLCNLKEAVQLTQHREHQICNPGVAGLILDWFKFLCDSSQLISDIECNGHLSLSDDSVPINGRLQCKQDGGRLTIHFFI